MTAISGYLWQRDEDIYENQNRGLFGSNTLTFTHVVSCFFLFLLLLNYLFGSYGD